jgi:hypothetical protein
LHLLRRLEPLVGEYINFLAEAEETTKIETVGNILFNDLRV